MVGSFVGCLVGAAAVRHLVRTGRVIGGAVPAFPADAAGFFGELISAVRTTGLGGPLAASPGLAAMGGVSALSLGHMGLAQKALLIALPALAAVLCYRACVRLTTRPGPSVVGASAYGLSALMLWSFSDGRLGLLVAMAAMPPILERVESAFSAGGPTDRPWRFVVGLGVTFAVAAAFVPGILLAVTVATSVQVVAGQARRRGVLTVLSAVLVCVVLLFPFVPTLIAGSGAALGSELGTSDPWAVGRLALGEAPGSWPVAWFLPVAAVLGLALSTGERRGPAIRATLTAGTALALAWASGAGYLPPALANAPAYTGLAAVAEAFLVTFGLASAVMGLGRSAFGFRQIGTVSIAAVLAGGLALQGLVAALGDWAVGGAEREVASWEAIVDTPTTGPSRVLWVGADDGRSFPWPGGDPMGVVEAGDATVRYSLTDRRGALAIDTARPLAGPGADALTDTIGEILGGTTLHGGALLVPFGVRYVVARQGELPEATEAILDAQADLDLVPAADLVIYRNAQVLAPAAAVVADEEVGSIVASDDPTVIQRWHDVVSVPLLPVVGSAGWEGETGGGNLAIVSTEFDPAWGVDAEETEPREAFGWSTSFPVSQGWIRITYGAQLPRTIEMVLLAIVWIAALWFTRRPVRR